MHRMYRRPGLARAIDDILEGNSRRRRPVRGTATARLERLCELLYRIASAKEAQTEHETPEDRRLALRNTALERPFEVQSEGGDPWPIFLEDVSRTGVRFRGEMLLACGQTITLRAPDTMGIDPIEARVVRAKMINPSLPERGYEYGAEYLVMDSQPHTWFLATRARG